MIAEGEGGSQEDGISVLLKRCACGTMHALCADGETPHREKSVTQRKGMTAGAEYPRQETKT